ncbi:adenylate/guanylate cyclase domain-containing protein [Bradyrhizobium sp.]|jgi:adenylate cyclase|uniref:adenylate/guanylate cyclase domain-containing protein n=1 Tax=Bradyrhizobium sp. TaxID=376 RepID=UPI002BBCC5DE|nr:adenylate/guanylate cyclase domain-containing protein [Bradyrhizobium sp.]HWX63861.1 adenylate/guanylate cyclase domain-containing protein [Bradyrhizobium sp.]
MTATTRRRLAAVLLAMAIFACLGLVTTAAVGRPIEIGTLNALLIGAGIGLFEEFYVQGPRGNWMRAMHPLRVIVIEILVVMVLYLVALHVTHVVLGRLDDLPVVYRRLPYGLAFFTAFSIVGILMMRVAHFVGLRTLLDLIIGTYHRPVEERKVLLFLDINGSTALSERLGALTMRAFVRKFLSDLSPPIVDHGGDIYLYKGDGLIAIWNWADAFRQDAILRAVDAMFATVAHETDAYQRWFGVAPAFRIGIHGGAVIVSEQGDARRSIGIYGDAINIAARMEEAARAHNVRCVISEVVAGALADRTRVRVIGAEQVKGISAPIAICEYAPGRLA